MTTEKLLKECEEIAELDKLVVIDEGGMRSRDLRFIAAAPRMAQLIAKLAEELKEKEQIMADFEGKFGACIVDLAHAEQKNKQLADKVRALEARAKNALGDARAVIIEEICQEYYQPIIDNFYAVRKQPDMGPYVHESDIKLWEKLQRELREQEWVQELSK